MGGIVAFWAVSLLTGACALPIAFVLLRRLPDRGAGMAAALGVVLLGYVYFMLRVFSVIPMGRGGTFVALGLLALLSAAVAGRDRRFRFTLRQSWPALFVMGGLFTLCFFGYSAFRSYTPDIGGTEQPMDLMYLNATISSPTYPPHDPWMAGERASYYYFGYLQAGVLTQMAGVSAGEGYNLALAYTFAAAATGIAALAYAAARWVLGSRARRWAAWAGAISVVLLLAVGSLSAVFELAAAHGYYNRGLYDLFGVQWLIPCPAGVTSDCFTGQLSPRTQAWYPTEFWFWWRGSRIIPNTITEFPFFSFLLGDLHPHVMSLPLVILALGVSASIWRGRSVLRLASHRLPFAGLGIAVLLGALAFENAWDILTFSAVLCVAVLLRNGRRLPWGWAILASAGYLLPIFIAAVVFYVPWYVDFRSQASGLYPYVGEGTRPEHALLQFGPLLLASALALAWGFRRVPAGLIGELFLRTAWLPLLPFAAWAMLARYHGNLNAGLDARGAGPWVTLALYGLLTWALAALFAGLASRRSGATFAVGLAATGALLLYGAELFLIRDIFYGAVPRLNTVFKLSYQAWVMLSVTGAVGLVVTARRLLHGRHISGLLGVPAAAALALGLVYPLIAMPARTDGFGRESTTIDGLAFLARNDPGEYALVRWVQQHTDPGDIIIEASGRTWRRDERQQPVVVDGRVDYTDSGRVSARTGRQTLIGWYFHEVQWRGDTPAVHKELDHRQQMEDAPYIAPDAPAAVAALREAGAKYIVVGRLENARYTGLMPDFASFLDLAFESAGTRVYALPSYRQVPTS